MDHELFTTLVARGVNPALAARIAEDKDLSEDVVQAFYDMAAKSYSYDQRRIQRG